MADFFRVTRDPSIMGGKACIRDTHITVSAVVALLSSGHQRDEVIRLLPALTREDLTEAVAYASRLIDDPESALREIEVENAPVEGGSGLPKTGPAPINTAVAPAPTRKMTPLGYSAEELETESPAPAAESETVLPNPYVPDSPSELDTRPLDESIELYHPAFPDRPTVSVSPEGIFDRRWGTHAIAWPDISGIERMSGQKFIRITLREPANYIASMPFFKRLAAQLKTALNIAPFYLDTSSLGVRTKDLYYMATRLWHAHRGAIKFRKKRRVRAGKSSRETAWEKCLPR